MYLANVTRPDIAYAVNYLARKQLEPTEDDWNDVKRIFRYLRRSTDLGIKFTSNSDQLEALTDSSFRDCENSTFTGGYVIRLFGDTIAWRSHKQSCTTLSTCQAEYLAMSDACQELISLDKINQVYIRANLVSCNHMVR
ncbi:secreted RxLR effector protein 161-like [Belonocnema kinseyi]|uniref:secreted RxLR effector protein 161-like n=1 Tax=Belonocnema kinseyi TaxID=2817044 RepID=UPI00143D7B87|nr:secreted RxLR effector protein 161-like [Belonocnema kinseyi]